MSTMFLTILTILLFLFSSRASSYNHRRILHQPLYPSTSLPPTQPPSSSPQTQPQPQQPKLPFSSISSSYPPPLKPFFPTYQPPPLPPSPPTVLATFPANISSLLLPQPRTQTHTHRTAAAVVISLCLFSITILTVSAIFAFHRRHLNHTSSFTTANDDNASRSDSLRLFPPNTATSDAIDGKPHDKPTSGSEIFHLGTVASSYDARVTEESTSGNDNDGFSPPYRQLTDSPELRPLPRLPRYNGKTWSTELNKEEDKKREDEEDEQFYSPKESPSGNKQQSLPPSSSSPVVTVAVAATSSRSFNVFHFDKFGSRSFTSRTPSYPLSYSLSRSPSLNLSPIHSVKSLPPHNPASPSFSSSSCSPIRFEDFRSNWDGKNSQTTKLSPPAPPPMPRSFWETPTVASENVNVNVNDETRKPKLKALHWDKVKASSDRAMVWDQLRPSSFQ